MLNQCLINNNLNLFFNIFHLNIQLLSNQHLCILIISPWTSLQIIHNFLFNNIMIYLFEYIFLLGLIWNQKLLGKQFFFFYNLYFFIWRLVDFIYFLLFTLIVLPTFQFLKCLNSYLFLLGNFLVNHINFLWQSRLQLFIIFLYFLFSDVFHF